MNKKLFFDGFINRIKEQFNIEENFAFEIFCMAPFLEMTFQELLNDVSTIVDGSGSNDAGFDGIYLDQEENTLHLFQIKNKNSIGDNELSKFLNDYNNIFVKNSKTKVLEEIYDASINSDHDLFALFNGNKNSEIYEQLYLTYRMYTFVVHMRQKKETENAPLSDFILYSDELMVYGLYKTKSRESDFEKTYETLYSAILSIVKERKKVLENKGLSYSHNGYFKSIYSKTDLDKKMGFISL